MNVSPVNASVTSLVVPKKQICVGNVLQAGSGALSSRVAQVRAGIPHTVPLSTVNRQCSSGLQAVAHVAAGIKAGHYAVGIAAGERGDDKRLFVIMYVASTYMRGQ